MKIKPKIKKIRENYYFDEQLVLRLEEIAQRTGYTRTQLAIMAIENLIKENE